MHLLEPAQSVRLRLGVRHDLESLADFGRGGAPALPRRLAVDAGEDGQVEPRQGGVFGRKCFEEVALLIGQGEAIKAHPQGRLMLLDLDGQGVRQNAPHLHAFNPGVLPERVGGGLEI